MDFWKNQNFWLAVAGVLLVIGIGSFGMYKITAIEARLSSLETRVQNAEANIESVKTSFKTSEQKINQIAEATPSIPHLKETPKELY